MNIVLSDLSKVLIDFGAGLNISPQEWVQREELLQLRLNDDDLTLETVKQLTYKQIMALLEAYGEALSCSFLLGGLEILKIELGITEKDLATFREDIGSSPTVRLEFKLDKVKLANNWR